MTRTLSVDPSAPPSPFVLDEAAKIIADGGVIVYPTETLYGIGADALNGNAVRNVRAAKRRREIKPILVIIHSPRQLGQLVAEVPPAARTLMEQFWPGPLTIVFKAKPGLPLELTQRSETIGVRIPSSAFCLELLQRCRCPLTSTSANISGEPVHRTIAEIRAVLGAGVDLFLDAGTLPESKPSTVVSVVESPAKVIREGVLSFDSLQAVLTELTR